MILLNKGKFIGDTYPWEEHQVYDKKFIFIHIHKAAGTSIKHSLGLMTTPRISSHTTAYWIISQKGKEWFKKMNSFTIVRNPWDRVVSAYHYRKQSKRVKENISFEKFIDLNNKDGMINLPNQLDYITWEDEIIVDDILRYETLNSDFNSYVKKHNIKLKSRLDVTNSSNHNDYRTYYTPELINTVGDHYAKEIKSLNYDF